jgi:hypothetical protein
MGVVPNIGQRHSTTVQSMKFLGRFTFSVLAATWSLAAPAATPSVSGSNVFAQPSITDAQGNIWTVVSGVIEKNAARVGSNRNVNLLLELNQVFYQRNTSDEWYEWTGSAWSPTSDPRVISASGTRIAAGSNLLVDSGQHVWALGSTGYAYVDGERADGNYNTIGLLYYGGVIYCENTSNEWYSWNGASWIRVPQDPTKSDTRAVSVNGSSIGVGTGSLVDAAGNVWTLLTNEYAYVNGTRAAGNSSTILILYYNAVIFCENTSGEWYSWNGSAWKLMAADPRGPSLVQTATYTSPVCPATDPGCTPAFEGNSSVTFTTVTTKGNAIWVAATVSDYGGIHVISVTDSQNNTYHELGQENDKAPGSQSVAQFYAGNILGGSDTITVQWSADNYKGVVAAEIAGVSAAPLVGSAVAVQDGNLAAGSNNVSTTAIALGASTTPSLVVALTMDTDGGGSDTGGSGYCAVPPGSGFAQVTQLWNWTVAGQPACNLATLETMTLTAAGSVSGAFTSTHVSDPYVTVSAVFH